MTATLTASQFTSPDTRPALDPADSPTESPAHVLDMERIREELSAALQHIEDLRHQYPYEATGYTGEPVQTSQQALDEGEYRR
ncbi:hypothetical protein [Streptomyces sp. sk2.1]|uniref:hypothetical protein n=1 Tax=Streptomyces sp. sk2.1 TaxID=2478959 RepID=UPI0011E754EB|nr:hypothetical protein [Streptomyces sp. sk2.1]TXS61459.1 hypothetical protein EAO76_41100 [Streptomyces sp. sk2.1]